MAELPEVFNLSDQDEKPLDGSYELVEPGWHTAEIVKSQLRETKNKDGKYLNFEFAITEGEYTGKRIFKQLNIVNKSKETVAIAKRHLASICSALDVGSIMDTEEIHGMPLQIKVTIKQQQKPYKDRNDIEAYRSVEGTSDDDIPF